MLGLSKMLLHSCRILKKYTWRIPHAALDIFEESEQHRVTVYSKPDLYLRGRVAVSDEPLENSLENEHTVIKQ